MECKGQKCSFSLCSPQLKRDKWIVHTYLILPKLLKLASESSANAIIWRVCLCCIPFRTKPDQSYHEKLIVLEHVCGWICVCALCMCTQEHMSVCGCLDIGICVGGCSSMCVGDQVCVCVCVYKWSVCMWNIPPKAYICRRQRCLSNPKHSCALWSGAQWMLWISAETWRQKPGGHLRGFSSDGSLGINPPSLQWENPALGLVFQVQLETVAVCRRGAFPKWGTTGRGYKETHLWCC